MSGPALRKVESHSSIHEAALTEASELTELLENLLSQNDNDKAYQVACILLEHWESRTLQHAESEEEGLYQEIKKESPKHYDAITALVRDHDMLREIAAYIKDQLAEQVINQDIAHQFRALIIIDELHNIKELTVLPEH